MRHGRLMAAKHRFFCCTSGALSVSSVLMEVKKRGRGLKNLLGAATPAAPSRFFSPLPLFLTSISTLLTDNAPDVQQKNRCFAAINRPWRIVLNCRARYA